MPFLCRILIGVAVATIATDMIHQRITTAKLLADFARREKERRTRCDDMDDQFSDSLDEETLERLRKRRRAV